ncbi:MAG: hypothetical protein ACOX0A_07295 [Thermoguttaceae bacterium]|jgi:hypothetical protein
MEVYDAAFKIFEKSIRNLEVPEDYKSTVTTGGPIEARYLADGPYEVSDAAYPTPEVWKVYEVYYPTALTTRSERWPVVVVANGVGFPARKCAQIYRHLASWGFIVIGNEDSKSYSGESVDRSLNFLLEEDRREGSVFYGKVDSERVGLIGHSQGGVATFNAAQQSERHRHEHFGKYSTAVCISPTQEEWAIALHIPYDPSKTRIPMLILAGARKDVVTLDGLKTFFEKIKTSTTIARRKGANHVEMLYAADGYATAWFMWRLRGDKTAAAAFVGPNPEIASNPQYVDLMTINWPPQDA